MPERHSTVTLLIKLLVIITGDTSEDTVVDTESDEERTTLTIKTTSQGRSLLIGKGRSMFQALKTIFGSLSGQDKHHYILRISGMRPGGKSDGN